MEILLLFSMNSIIISEHDGKRRRTEKNANKFALEFIEAFKKTVNRLYKPMLLITPPELPSMTRIIFLPLWSY